MGWTGEGLAVGQLRVRRGKDGAWYGARRGVILSLKCLLSQGLRWQDKLMGKTS